MKEVLVVALTALAVSGQGAAQSGGAQELTAPSAVVGHYGSTNVVVEAGEAALEGTLCVDAQADGLIKRGAGTLTVPINRIVSSEAARVTVREGTVRFTRAEQDASVSAEPPAVIAEKAALWLKADTNLVAWSEDPTRVLRWHDVRETSTVDGTWGESQCAAEAQPAQGVTNFPTVVSVQTATGAKDMLDFHGIGSKCWMRFLNATRAEADVSDIRHAFIVVDIEKTYGFMFGASWRVFLHPASTSGTLDAFYASHISSDPVLPSSRFYLDGELVNPAQRRIQKGVQVIEMECGVRTGHLRGIFTDRGIAGRFGGDYVGEMILFTRRLSAAERLAVSHYLLAKWTDKNLAGNMLPTVAKGAVADFDLGEERPVVSGGGTVVRTGEAPANIANAYGHAFAGAIRQEAGAGATTLSASALPLAFKKGDCATATADAYAQYGITTTADAGLTAAGKAVYAGSAPLALRSAEDGMRRLTARGTKEVTISSRRNTPAETAEGLRATIVDGDCEKYFGGSPTAGTSLAWGGSGTMGGWTYATSGAFGFMNVNKNVDIRSWLLWSAPAVAEPGGDYEVYYAVDGIACMVLKGPTTAQTSATVPVTGDYEFSFYQTSRIGYDGCQFNASLVSKSDSSKVYDICQFDIVRENGWQPCRFLVRNLEKGEYFLKVEGSNGKNNDGHIFLDDFRLTLVTAAEDRAETFAVPNGSFEVHSHNLTKASTLSKDFTATGWTLVQGTLGAAATDEKAYNSDVILASRWGRINGSGVYGTFFNASGRWGEEQLNLRSSDGYAETDAFTMPAGTWRLTFTAANSSFSDQTELQWNGHNSNLNSTLQASVFVNGTEVPLGKSAAISSIKMADYALQTTFTVAAGDTVKLRLRQGTVHKEGDGYANQTAVLALDEVWFERVDGPGAELVDDGSFESTLPWTRHTNNQGRTGEYNNAFWRTHTESDTDYGSSRCEGSKAAVLVDIGSVTQEIEIGAPGFYRLGFWTRARYNKGTDHVTSDWYGGNRIRAWLIGEDGVTNEVYRTGDIYSTNYVEHSALFPVAKAGHYTLGLQGCNDPFGGQTTGKSAKADKNAFLDCVSLKRMGVEELPDLPETLVLALGEEATLRLDYAGTNTIRGLRFGNTALTGTVDATHPSGKITGPGALTIKPDGGALLLVR